MAADPAADLAGDLATDMASDLASDRASDNLAVGFGVVQDFLTICLIPILPAAEASLLIPPDTGAAGDK